MAALSGTFRGNRQQVTETVAPTDTPVSLQECKDWARITNSDDDCQVQTLLNMAVRKATEYMRRSIVTRTLQLDMDSLPGESQTLKNLTGVHQIAVSELNGVEREIQLPFGRVASITSVTTFARDNSSAVFDSSNYILNMDRVVLNDSSVWPADIRRRGGVQIVYVAGFGEPEDVPADIKQGILELVRQAYDTRSACKVTGLAKECLDTFKVHDVLTVNK